MRFTIFAVIASLALLASAMTVQAEDAAVRAKAKELMEKNKDAIVTIKLVTTTRYVYMGRESHKQENKMEVTGTVLDASGLTVLSYYSTDPYSAMGDFSYESGGDKVEFKPETSVNELKIVLADGTEIPADFVLKDPDLDLAFVKPKEKLTQAPPFIALAKPAAEPEVLDSIISIGRMGREVNRANCVKLGSIDAMVKKPRTFYVCDSGLLGCPVFNAKGETLGLSVMRKSPVKSSGFSANMSQVVLPTEDVLEAAKQAAAAKPLSEKKDEKKEGEATKDQNAAAPATTETK